MFVNRIDRFVNRIRDATSGAFVNRIVRYPGDQPYAVRATLEVRFLPGLTTMSSQFTSTCRAPVNIAVIKYWGKSDERLIIPINDSLSLTLSTDDLCATTTVTASPDFEDDQLWLNGKVTAHTGEVFEAITYSAEVLPLIRSSALRFRDG